MPSAPTQLNSRYTMSNLQYTDLGPSEFALVGSTRPSLKWEILDDWPLGVLWSNIPFLPRNCFSKERQFSFADDNSLASEPPIGLHCDSSTRACHNLPNVSFLTTDTKHPHKRICLIIWPKRRGCLQHNSYKTVSCSEPFKASSLMALII